MIAQAVRILVADSATTLDGVEGNVLVTGSHGGVYPATLTAAAGARAAIFNDGSRGLDDAGVAGLTVLQGLGIPAAAVGHLTAWIGTGASTLEEGQLSTVNDLARELGCEPGMAAREAARRLRHSVPGPAAAASMPEAARHALCDQVWALDSAAAVCAGDSEAIVFCGSHGGLLGGRPETALRHPVRLAVFNDAGGGPDERGATRLGALAERGIPAAVVSAASARLGDGRSTYETGVLSAVNQPAAARGLTPGMNARDVIDAIRTSHYRGAAS